MIRVYLIVVSAMLFSGAVAEAEEFILRATDFCCESDSSFPSGSSLYLKQNGKRAGSDEIDDPRPFRIDDINAGKYDLVVNVEGYYPAKYLDVPIGEDGEFDFELAVGLLPLDAFVLEGQMIIKLRKSTSFERAKSLLAAENLRLQRRLPDHDGMPERDQYFDVFPNYILINAGFDRDRDATEIIEEIMLLPEVLDCYPISLSSGK